MSRSFNSSMFGTTPAFPAKKPVSTTESMTTVIRSGLRHDERDVPREHIETHCSYQCELKNQNLVVTSLDPQTIDHLEKDIECSFPGFLNRPCERPRDPWNVYVPLRGRTRTHDEIVKEFEKYGPLVNVHKHSRSACYFVRFKKKEDAQEAIKGYNAKRDCKEWCSSAFYPNDHDYYAILRRCSEEREEKMKAGEMLIKQSTFGPTATPMVYWRNVPPVNYPLGCNHVIHPVAIPNCPLSSPMWQSNHQLLFASNYLPPVGIPIAQLGSGMLPTKQPFGYPAIVDNSNSADFVRRTSVNRAPSFI